MRKRKWIWKKQTRLNAPAMVGHFVSSALYSEAARIGKKYPDDPAIQLRTEVSSYRALEQAALAFASMYETHYVKSHAWVKFDQEPVQVLIEGLLGSWDVRALPGKGVLELHVRIAVKEMSTGYFAHDAYYLLDHYSHYDDMLWAALNVRGTFDMFQPFLDARQYPQRIGRKRIQIFVKTDGNLGICLTDPDK